MSKLSPKQQLLAWVNQRVDADRHVTNFTSDWKDGRTLAALVSSLAPGDHLPVLTDFDQSLRTKGALSASTLLVGTWVAGRASGL